MVLCVCVGESAREEQMREREREREGEYKREKRIVRGCGFILNLDFKATLSCIPRVMVLASSVVARTPGASPLCRRGSMQGGGDDDDDDAGWGKDDQKKQRHELYQVPGERMRRENCPWVRVVARRH